MCVCACLCVFVCVCVWAACVCTRKVRSGGTQWPWVGKPGLHGVLGGRAGQAEASPPLPPPPPPPPPLPPLPTSLPRRGHRPIWRTWPCLANETAGLPAAVLRDLKMKKKQFIKSCSNLFHQLECHSSTNIPYPKSCIQVVDLLGLF